MDVIKNNPFRILGVHVNASIRDIKANEAKAKAFLNVGRDVTYPCDFNQLLSSIQRTAEMMASANSQLTLPNEKIKHALFWFAKVTPLDEIAFNHLANGNAEQTMGIWKKKECFSSLLNTSTQALAQGHVLKAVDAMMTLLESETYRQDFIKSVIDETFQIAEEELVHIYLDALIPDSIYPLLELSTLSDKYKGYIKDKLIAPVIADIESEVTKAKSIKRENASARYNAGVQLMNLAKDKLTELKKLLVGSDMRYQIIADKLGLEILQCGIDYYNNSEDADAAQKAMKLQNYAQSVVIGQMAKDRCKQNTDILKKIIAELPPMEVLEEDRAIRKELERFCNLPDKIQYAIDLLQNTRPYLITIKNRLGNTNASYFNSFYLKLSTQIVGYALHNVIEEINSKQKSLEITILLSEDYRRREILESNLKPLLQEAWRTIKLMDGFDMEYDFKTNRYNPNRESLENMCKQMGVISYKPFGIPTSSTPKNTLTRTQSYNSSNNKEEKEINPIVAILIIHLIWGFCYMSSGDKFWEGFILGIGGWIFPINMIGYYILNWIYKKINE